MKKDRWIWMPHAGHFALSDKCQFHLNTYVGKYIVSTVGEYLPDFEIREMLAKCRGIKLEGKGDEREKDWMKKIGFEKIGADKLYETMVFKAKKSKYLCCPYRIIVSKNVDCRGYNSADEAYKGHLKLCNEWSKK